MQVLSADGSDGSDMEKDEGSRAGGGGGGAEPLRAREKILCYINMQSPGRSSTAPSPTGGSDPLLSFYLFFLLYLIKLCQEEGGAPSATRSSLEADWPISVLSFKPTVQLLGRSSEEEFSGMSMDLVEGVVGVSSPKFQKEFSFTWNVSAGTRPAHRSRWSVPPALW